MRTWSWTLLWTALGLAGCAIEPNPSPATGAETPDAFVPSDAGQAAPDVAEADDVAPGPDDVVAPEDAADAADTPDAPDDVNDASDVIDVVPDDPAGEGPLGFEQETLSIEVEPGLFGESIEVVVYTPQAEGPHPTVVFLHGFQLGPANYASYGEHLARWGFVAVMPSLSSGFDLPNHVELKDTALRVLDWLSEGPLAPTVDLTRVGMAGHSMGGKISAFVAAVDSRPRAIFLIDPVDAGPPIALDPAGYPSIAPEMMPDVAVPLVALGETNNATGGVAGQPCAPEGENFVAYYQAATSPALKVHLLMAAHMSFLDDPDCGFACLACPEGTDDPSETRRLTRGLMTAFFRQRLNAEPGWSHWLTGLGVQPMVEAGAATIDSRNGF